MRVILQERVANLGNVGDLVTVKPGYGRNFLLPLSKAVLATEDNVKLFETRRADLEKKAEGSLKQAQQRAEKLATSEVTMSAQASEEGKLYGSIGPRDVAIAVSESGIELNKSEVSMPDGPIRTTGEHNVIVQLHSEVEATIKVVVKAQATQ